MSTTIYEISPFKILFGCSQFSILAKKSPKPILETYNVKYLKQSTIISSQLNPVQRLKLLSLKLN